MIVVKTDLTFSFISGRLVVFESCMVVEPIVVSRGFSVVGIIVVVSLWSKDVVVVGGGEVVVGVVVCPIFAVRTDAFEPLTTNCNNH